MTPVDDDFYNHVVSLYVFFFVTFLHFDIAAICYFLI